MAFFRVKFLAVLVIAKLSASSGLFYPPSNTTVKPQTPTVTYHYNDSVIVTYDFPVKNLNVDLHCYIDLATAQAAGNKTVNNSYSRMHPLISLAFRWHN